MTKLCVAANGLSTDQSFGRHAPISLPRRLDFANGKLFVGSQVLSTSPITALNQNGVATDAWFVAPFQGTERALALTADKYGNNPNIAIVNTTGYSVSTTLPISGLQQSPGPGVQKAIAAGANRVALLRKEGASSPWTVSIIDGPH
jgi:hypothetical protein